MKYLLLLLLFSASIEAKEIYITISTDGYHQQQSYTLDPKLKVWQLQDYVFENNNLSSKNYSLVSLGAEGYAALKPENNLASYGNAPNDPVMFYVVKKHQAIKKETESEKAEDKQEPKEEEQPKVADEPKADDEPKKEDKPKADDKSKADAQPKEENPKPENVPISQEKSEPAVSPTTEENPPPKSEPIPEESPTPESAPPSTEEPMDEVPIDEEQSNEEISF